MKKSLVLASLITASTSMMAMNIEYFGGVDLSRADANVKDTVNLTGGTLTIGSTSYNTVGSESWSYSSDDTAPAFKLGVILDETHRIYLKYGKYDGVESSEMKLTTLNYDYMFSGLKHDYKIVPYVGTFVGHGKLETQIGNGSGVIYGVDAGFVVPITKNVEFDFNLAYMKSNIDASTSWSNVNATEGNITLTNVSGNYEVEVRNATIANFGINFRF